MLFVHLFGLRLFVFSSVFSSSWCLGRADSCDCGTYWTFLLPFFIHAFNLLTYLTRENTNAFIYNAETSTTVSLRSSSEFSISLTYRKCANNRLGSEIC